MTIPAVLVFMSLCGFASVLRAGVATASDLPKMLRVTQLGMSCVALAFFAWLVGLR